MGLFSAIDALTDKPMDEILTELPLTETIRDALLGTDGPFRKVFLTVTTYENGQWEDFARRIKELALDEATFPDLYRKAVRWASQALAVF
jgi:EAL and modified HD-GYP domain-containing signal transduction protein